MELALFGHGKLVSVRDAAGWYVVDDAGHAFGLSHDGPSRPVTVEGANAAWVVRQGGLNASDRVVLAGLADGRVIRTLDLSQRSRVDARVLESAALEDGAHQISLGAANGASHQLKAPAAFELLLRAWLEGARRVVTLQSQAGALIAGWSTEDAPTKLRGHSLWRLAGGALAPALLCATAAAGYCPAPSFTDSAFISLRYDWLTAEMQVLQLELDQAPEATKVLARSASGNALNRPVASLLRRGDRLLIGGEGWVTARDLATGKDVQAIHVPLATPEEITSSDQEPDLRLAIKLSPGKAAVDVVACHASRCVALRAKDLVMLGPADVAERDEAARFKVLWQSAHCREGPENPRWIDAQVLATASSTHVGAR
ncbi:MAG: hypothetical protein EOO73_10700 [Myxococcales bacterium]|nr:MAG: hypothetical protein EOO73_10700 [Myxococcales bacterium]